MEWMLMPYRRYAEFTGRSRRKEYWMFALLMLIVYSVIAALLFSGGLSAMLMNPSETTPTFGPAFWLGVVLVAIFGLGSFIPSIAVTIRRLHDRDMSGWWYLLGVFGGAVPFIGPLISIGFLVLMCLPGTPGHNRFGPDPKDPTSADVFA